MSDSDPVDFRSLRVPCWCPQCGLPMKGKSTGTFYRFGVCVMCFIFFIEQREQRWLAGWRPSPEDLQAYLSQVR